MGLRGGKGKDVDDVINFWYKINKKEKKSLILRINFYVINLIVFLINLYKFFIRRIL